jgi:hypothetical protein
MRDASNLVGPGTSVMDLQHTNLSATRMQTTVADEIAVALFEATRLNAAEDLDNALVCKASNIITNGKRSWQGYAQDNERNCS